MDSHKQYVTIECNLDSCVYNILLVFAFGRYFQTIKGALRYVCARLATYGVLLVTGLACIPVFLFSPKNVNNSKFFAKYIGRHVSHFYGIKWIVRGEENLAGREGAVVIANHQHELDILCMFKFWPYMEKCSAVSKKDLLWNPFGFAAWLAGVVFINRRNPKSAKDRLNKAAKYLHENTKIFMFPEGTRNLKVKETKKFLQFKKGAFRIAIDNQVPIIPIVISPYHFVDDVEFVLKRGGKVIISVLPPVSTKGLQVRDVDALLNSVKEKMQTEYNKLDYELTHCT